ncbi:MAG: hypothetical protein HY064_04470 [Bacteroidetes bacterium]|nr:hypothetical protein [Bacteroidota bacterium]
MKAQIIFILFFVSVIGCAAQKDSIVHSKDGKDSIIFHFKKEHIRRVERFYPDGKLSEKTLERKNGDFRWDKNFYENGKLKSLMKNRIILRNIKRKFWDENGKKSSVEKTSYRMKDITARKKW